ncbi:MAG: peptide chain release factor 2 [Bdellovibrionales bacterium]|nr:peptide chain release factor 2 [Bdellovibrionales bacterium]
MKPKNCGGIFDIDQKVKRLEELESAMQNPDVWNNHEEMQKINKEKSLLEKSVQQYQNIVGKVDDTLVLLEMAEDENDEATFSEIKVEINFIEHFLEDLELKSFLSSETDGNSAYLSVNSGAGGTEACDWASMLFRMYTRYAEREGYKVEVLSMTEGEEAGIKSVTLYIEGPYAFGHLKAENGVHRLVRISPFDSNARRHTSFASVFAWPEIDDDVEIAINPEDIKVDTYRASGAGGQHINTTDSAVRITHIPTGTVVTCQNQRSQHANKDKAMKMLKAALYEQEMEKRQREIDQMNAEKKANEWGSQIRSYVLHPYKMVKDHRTNTEDGNPDAVLDGNLNKFIESYLKSQKVNNKESH